MGKITVLIILGFSLHAQVSQRSPATVFKGSGAPGSIIFSRWGDIYVNVSSGTAYICTDPTSFCGSVASGEWVALLGSPGGTSGQIQYNNSGVFGGLDSTGSGNIVRSTSPTLVTPALGTPSTITLTNATDVSTTPTAGQIPRADGSGNFTFGSGQSRITLTEGTAPASPSATQHTLYVDSSDGHVKRKNSSGTVVDLEAGGLADPGGNGLLSRTSSGVTINRTLTAGSSKVAVTNGDGTAGNPTVDVTEANLTLNNLGGTLGISKGGTNLTALGTSNQVLGVNNAAGNLEYKTLTAGSNVTITHGANDITIAATGGGSSTTGLYSGILNFGSIADGSCSDLTFSATGATANMPLAVSLPNGIASGVVGTGFVSAADTVSIRLCNFSGSSVDPANATYYVRNLDSLGYISGSATINPAALADGNCTDAGTITVTGSTVGDNVAPGWPSTLNAGVYGVMFVSAADTVSVRLCNWSGATIDVASSTFKAGITK